MTAAAVQLKLIAEPSYGPPEETGASVPQLNFGESHNVGTCKPCVKHDLAAKAKRRKSKIQLGPAIEQTLPEQGLHLFPDMQSESVPPGSMNSGDALLHEHVLARLHPGTPQSFHLAPTYSANAAWQQCEANTGILEAAWSCDWRLQVGEGPGVIDLTQRAPTDQMEFGHPSAWTCWNEPASWQDRLSEHWQLQGFDGDESWQLWQSAERYRSELPPNTEFERHCTKLELDKLLPVSHVLPAQAVQISAMAAPTQTSMYHPSVLPAPMMSLEHSAPSLSQESPAYLKPPPGLSVLTAPPGLSVLKAPPGLDVMDTPSCQSDMPAIETWSLSGERETPSSVSEGSHGACSRSQSPHSSVDTRDTTQLRSSASGLGSSDSSFKEHI